MNFIRVRGIHRDKSNDVLRAATEAATPLITLSMPSARYGNTANVDTR